MSGLESYQPKDRFSKLSGKYAAFRPTYPQALYDFILSHVKNRSTAWDCATGNGQVAKDLAPHFDKIFATDISIAQIESAVRLPNVEYSVSQAHESGFPSSTFDLITVGQAIHWFDIPAFYEEVKRVAKPDAVLAIWGYGLLKINPGLDELMNDFYVNIIGPYWDAERKLIDARYRTIPFPFDEIQTPEFDFSFEWTMAQFEGYLTTWSAVQKYITATGENPVAQFMARVREQWKDEFMKVRFPLFVRIGKIS